MVPSVVRKFTQIGFEVGVQSGAGRHAFASDQEYLDAGAEIVSDESMADALATADVVASVRGLDYARASRLKKGAVAVSFLAAVADADTVRGLRDAGATGLSFDFLPRISRAQSMDALTSQALVTGYRAALVAADRLPSFFPLFMTAAGTIQPAKVLLRVSRRSPPLSGSARKFRLTTCARRVPMRSSRWAQHSSPSI
jgi:NAD(P) transhydrogenase subunit alpha